MDCYALASVEDVATTITIIATTTFRETSSTIETLAVSWDLLKTN